MTFDDGLCLRVNCGLWGCKWFDFIVTIGWELEKVKSLVSMKFHFNFCTKYFNEFQNYNKFQFFDKLF